MKRVLVLVEGQTEEGFINEVLRPHLAPRRIWLIPTILTTKRTKSGPYFKGGVTSYQRAKNDVVRSRCPHFDGWLRRLEALGDS